jgi:hypothetical protein
MYVHVEEFIPQISAITVYEDKEVKNLKELKEDKKS